jgi:hypothetical protein
VDGRKGQIRNKSSETFWKYLCQIGTSGPAGACQKLRFSGKLDPANPRQYNDVCIAFLARQIGATVVTRDINDFKKIKRVVDFKIRDIIHA